MLRCMPIAFQLTLDIFQSLVELNVKKREYAGIFTEPFRSTPLKYF